MTSADRPAAGPGSEGGSGATTGIGDPPGGAPAAEEAVRRTAAAGQEAAGDAEAQMRGFAEDQKRVAAGEIGGLADALRGAARELQQEQYPTIADYTRRAAANLEGLSESLRKKDLATLVDEAEHFARRQPAMFLGGSLVGGFLLARFLKSSAARTGVPPSTQPPAGA